MVEEWRERGLAQPWTDRFTVLTAGQEPSAKSGPMRWRSPGALRSLVEDLADGLPLEHAVVGVVDGDPATGRLLVDGRAASAVALAMPDAQAERLLGPGLRGMAEQLDRPSDPVIALVAWWAERTWDGVSPDGRFEAAFVNGNDVLASIADDGRRRGDDAPVLVAHSTPGLAAAHLADPAQAGAPMLAALRGLLDLGEPRGTHVHRWALARPAAEREAPYLLTDGLVGVCGDGWGPQSKVETAWLSGRALGRAISERLG